jgi:hypothetical protein
MQHASPHGFAFAGPQDVPAANPSDRLPPWQLSKAHFDPHQDKSSDVVKAFENAFATWRFGVQPDRLNNFFGHMVQTLLAPFCAIFRVDPTAFRTGLIDSTGAYGVG